MIGLESLVTRLSITSADYTSLKDKTQGAHDIRTMIINIIQMVLVVSIIGLLMIYLASAYQIQKHNTMMKTLLVHNKWSTR